MKAIDRLFVYITHKGFKHTRFEKDIGLSNGYLGRQKQRGADIGSSILAKIIVKCQDLNVEWLLTGQGSMLNTKSDSVDLAQVDEAQIQIGKISSDHYLQLLKENNEELGATKQILGVCKKRFEGMSVKCVGCENWDEASILFIFDTW